ncbi:MAG TPA: HEAT repeat domain-containing protein [Candidatus Avalokitesvara rifleensis]|uniref:HEAT repeat domain-containing protein n=1 Tax=Candidatus Avalokitesvara rifleensis TaxID=3367620 RepID=UPI00402737B8
MNKLLTLTLCWLFLTALGSHINPLLGEAPPETQSVSSTDIDRWTKQLYSSDPAIRSSAAISLLRTDNQKALEPLLNILNNSLVATVPPQKNDSTAVSNNEVLISVMKAFGFKGDDRAVGPIINLLQDENPDIRQNACEALGDLHSSKAIQKMSANLLNPGFPQEGRVLLAQALGKTMEQEAVGPLITALRETASVELQDTALEALRHISGKSYSKNPSDWEDWWAVNRHKTREEWLRDIVTKLGVTNKQLQEKNESVEKELAEKSLALLKKAVDNKDQKALVEALRSQYPEVRVAAAKALAQTDNPETVSALATALRNDREKDVRVAAAQSLGELGDESAAESLLRALNDENVSVRESAARALANFKGEDVVKSLTGLLNENTTPVAIAAAESLGQVGSAKAVEPLLELLNNKNAKVREVVAIALGKIKDPRAVPPLINSLKDPEERVRYAADSLGSIGSSEGVEPLIELLSKGSPRLRESAATALGQIRDERALEALVHATEDADKRVAEQAADALLSVDMQSYEAMEYLADTFYDRTDYKRAIQILNKQISKFSTSETHKDKIRDRRLKLAIAYQQQKDWQQASEQYDMLVSEQKPKDLNLMVALIECLKELKQYTRMLEHYSVWIKEQPEHATVWWEGRLEIIYTLFEQGNHEKIQKLVDEFQLEDPELGGPRLKRQFLELAESSASKTAHAQMGRAATHILP